MPKLGTSKPFVPASEHRESDYLFFQESDNVPVQFPFRQICCAVVLFKWEGTEVAGHFGPVVFFKESD